MITKVFNLSIEQQCVPLMWKLTNVNPLPKESPLTECNQLSPISLKNIIMRLFERVVCKQEIASAFKSVIGRDQFAYKEGTNTTDDLTMCLHHWFKWLDEGADSVRVISFAYKKARTAGYGFGSFSIFVDGYHIKPMDAQNNLLVKFADDITTSAPVKSGSDSAEAEVESIQNWSEANQMTLNVSKTWEMVVHGGSMKPLPAPIVGNERKSWLKLLGVTFQENP
ncbi:Hypothetical predicted protein [Paramuricea clavata]|uniref:Uncharacterized protein n=1 Tax=Paramuricea clavata TaxID=317549 RepID=A0A6S7IWP0_PARCT|nr:Hypothetical predicted protein [Paramuricea clavata]